jgi:hypothetical protein
MRSVIRLRNTGKLPAQFSPSGIFVDDFDARLAQIAGKGIEPSKQRDLSRQTYSNGVRHATYHDPEGNEISFGGAPL